MTGTDRRPSAWFLTYLKDEPYEALADMREALDGLTDHPGWAVYEELVQSVIDRVTREMRHSVSVKSKAWYGAMNAQALGLETALAAPATVVMLEDRARKQLESLVGEEQDG